MNYFAVFTGSLVCSFGIAYAAQAGTFHRGWTYSIDALDDGSGGPAYEVEGLAVKETGENVYVSVTGGTALTGVDTDNAEDGNIGWGDLLLNFTGTDLNSANGELWGIRFAATNDSGVSDVGVFRHVTAQSVAAVNNGHNSLTAYYGAGYGRDHTLGDMATEAAALAYVGAETPVLSSISTGTLVGTIDFLSESEAAQAGLDFAHFDVGDEQTHTVRFNRSLVPNGSFIASLFLECVNDGIALLSNFQDQPAQDVPESSNLWGLMGLGLLASRIPWRKGT
ncbi:XDD3 family exosortase-dependent surface protein [Leptothoe sp. PORK10 BA2]|uniref:XDD3 family exosortase-dependent surface protein n=1 Tax=Leptothoe sp. PORK10 BA2 TaxID=3110254 RepID=UPI002B1F9335|nr:XDD3 family exosortase-dependent surface protein [Leptothoe sp. PORK10 BA2]MEA5465393.1 XDD3 family exosortase-dependent surface protein [Leptothoe sp. PORK10 BA2]